MRVALTVIYSSSCEFAHGSSLAPRSVRSNQKPSRPAVLAIEPSMSHRLVSSNMMKPAAFSAFAAAVRSQQIVQHFQRLLGSGGVELGGAMLHHHHPCTKRQRHDCGQDTLM